MAEGSSFPIIDRGAVLAAHEEQLFRTLSAIYATTGRFATVHSATSRAQKRLARLNRYAVDAEGWIV